MAHNSVADIRDTTPEEHWAHFERAWTKLLSYRYLGKGTPYLDKGVEREVMPLRGDMRNSTGGMMAAPLCIAAPEPWWRDDECVPAPVTMSYAVLDPAHDVRRIEVLREVISVGRQMGFSRARIVDADDHDRVIALSTGSGVSLGDVPPGFEPVDNPVYELEDSPDLPALRDVFGVVPGPDGALQIDAGHARSWRRRTRRCTSARSTSPSRRRPRTRSKRRREPATSRSSTGRC